MILGINLGLWLIYLFSLLAHDFHNSIAEMHYNLKSQSFEVSLRVFTDDFENILKKENHLEYLSLSKAKTHEPLIESYLKKNFIIRNAKNQALVLSYIGKEIEGEVIWLYFEIPYKEKLKNLTLQHTILLDLFDDQTNLINIFYKNHKQTLLFTRRERVQKLEFPT
ncbi:MAG: hypothetical protein NZ551_06410 [Microscillaceae bacterium]|nr:hypothetical protein [Microscillaceae bacterium]MDW8460826.1 hypothetical protein [Cytophagales bacterium]